MRFNELYPPFDNVKMRQAVLHTIDQKEYMGAVTGNDASAFQVCHSFFPCGTPYGVTPSPDRMAKPDWALAHKLVQEAGYKGEKIVLINPTDFATIQPFGEITTPTSRSSASTSTWWKPTGARWCSGAN